MICITGIPGSGKTTTANTLSKMLGLSVYCIDHVYYDIARYLGISDPKDIKNFANPNVFLQHSDIEPLKRRFYQIHEIPDNIILEGYGLCFPLDRECLGISKKDTFFYLDIDFKDWLRNVGNFRSIIPERDKRIFDWIKGLVDLPEYAYTVDKTIDLFIPDYAVYSGLANNFVAKKVESLHLPDLRGKSVIDLGGNSGEIARACLLKGASKVLVVDMNWRHLERAKGLKRKLFNLNYIDRFKESADVVLCISTLHYIKDKRSFLAKCAQITKDYFILECPIDGKTRIDGITTPTLNEIRSLLKESFVRVNEIGPSLAPDGSNRQVFHAFI
jgi:shikimate kinase